MISEREAAAYGADLCDELVKVYDWLSQMSYDGRLLTVQQLTELLHERAEAIWKRFNHLEPFGKPDA